MKDTPSPERLHITILGRRNSGKSTLFNAITGQEASLVSEVPGTTTDPVRKAMEIPGAGPCLFTDTAGFDDDDGRLGKERRLLTAKALQQTDIAIMIFRDCGSEEKEWFRTVSARKIPVIPVINKADTSTEEEAGMTGRLAEETERLCGTPPVLVCAKTGEGVQDIYSAILRAVPEEHGRHSITGGLAGPGDTVVLVMPQDILAPKGRLILPQAQTIRELLELGCTVISCTADTFQESLAKLSSPPDLIITDSQVFGEIYQAKPPGTPLTSFSILFAAYKGDIGVFMQGAEALGHLDGRSRILIAEACTHAPAAEDIGRVKIPEMLRRRFGEGIRIDIVSGSDFPQDLSPYDIVIHCGACMFNRSYVMNRIAAARAQKIPVTNYGIAIAMMKGILDKVVFPASQGQPAAKGEGPTGT